MWKTMAFGKEAFFFFFYNICLLQDILEAPRLGFLFSLQLAQRFLWLSTYNYFSIKALICYVVSTAPWRFGKNEDETVNLFSSVSLDENRVRLGPGEAAAEPRWDFKGSYARRKPQKKASFGLYVGGRNFHNKLRSFRASCDAKLQICNANSHDPH